MKATLLLAAALLSAIVTPASATDWPTRPIRIVVPYSPGGSTDIIARMLAERLTHHLGQAAVVENRPGGSEQIATTSVTKAAPDGHTILLSTLTGLAVNPGLYGPKLQYDPQKELAPVLLVGSVPSAVVVHPSVPAKSISELVTYLRANSDKANYGSAGNGTPSHLAMEFYKRQNGVDAAHVPYKGGAPALQELMAGQVQLMIALVPEAMPLAKAGRLRALAVTSAKRLPEYPDVPTVPESGGKAFDASFWYAFMAPAATPPEVINKLNKALNAILQEPAARAKMADLSVEVAGGTPGRVSDLMRADAARWKKVIDEANIRID